MTKIEKPKSENAVAVSDLKLPTSSMPDPFKVYADSVTQRTFIGELLKFSKGEFFAGKNARLIPAGSKFVANLDELHAGLVKWVNGRPVSHVLIRVADGLPRPQRGQLGDDDPDKWQFDSQGQPRDPWQEINYLPLLGEDGKLYTFSVSSGSGIREVGALCDAYASHRQRKPDEFPVVTLDVDSFQHRDRSLGRIKYPQLNNIGWVVKEKFAQAVAAAGERQDAVRSSAKRVLPAHDDIADEIPF